MDASAKVQQVFEAATKMGLRTYYDSRNRETICFNEKSKKSLHRDHVCAIVKSDLSAAATDREINALIKSVAPGRPCTHKGMTAILRAVLAPSK